MVDIGIQRLNFTFSTLSQRWFPLFNSFFLAFQAKREHLEKSADSAFFARNSSTIPI